MLITNSKVMTDDQNKLRIENEELEKVTQTKFLGLVIDDKLSWVNHIDHCKKKIASGIYAMISVKNFLTSEHLLILYYSLIHPYLLYGNIVWGNTYRKYLNKLEILQKKAIRAIANLSYKEHTSPLYKNLDILK